MRIASFAAIIALMLLVAGCTVSESSTNSTGVLASQDGGVLAQQVRYYGSTSGYLARPQGNATYPGVVMIHEYWGLNDNIKQMARRLAAQGYTVLAVDLYNGTVATTPQQAVQAMTSVNASEALANMQAAAAYLRLNESSSRVASLGWCFGGGQSLRLALSGDQLDAAVLYYGSPLITNESALRALTMPVLGVFGDVDKVVPVDQVRQFNASLNSLGVRHEIYLYPGVGHAFANPSNPGYDKLKTADAWNKTIAFLDANLKR